jgi:hypothetical protein
MWGGEYGIYEQDVDSAGILEQSMWATNREGTKLSYRPAKQCCLAGRYDKPIPIWFLAPLDCSKIPALETTTEPEFVNLMFSRIDSARLHRLEESIPFNRFLCSSNVYKFGHRIYTIVQCIYISKRYGVSFVRCLQPLRLAMHSFT